MDDVKAFAMIESGNQFLDGHFGVPLPWKGAKKTRSDNKAPALTRLHYSQRKLARGENSRTVHEKSLERALEKACTVVSVKTRLSPSVSSAAHSVSNSRNSEILQPSTVDGL